MGIWAGDVSCYPVMSLPVLIHLSLATDAKVLGQSTVIASANIEVVRVTATRLKPVAVGVEGRHPGNHTLKKANVCSENEIHIQKDKLQLTYSGRTINPGVVG